MGLKDRSPARSRPQASNQNRVRIAQAAARLIVEHGITDWTLAKRKAARQLMLPEREALPGDDEVAAALAGLHVARVQVLAFVVSSACAGLAAMATSNPNNGNDARSALI